MQINGIESLHSTGVITASQSTDAPVCRSGGLPVRGSSRLWQGCHCASTLPKSRTSFRFWNMGFHFEQQEHHHPSCKLWGTKKGTKRRARADVPLILSWFSVRMTYACFEYASGTSRPGLSLRCRNVVRHMDSPVCKLIWSFHRNTAICDTPKQLVRRLESLERDILTLYSKGLASPLDTTEYGKTHAEVKTPETKI
jgi:hypothetical protein